MKLLIFSAIFLIILSACNRSNIVIENVSEPFSLAQLEINSNANNLELPVLQDKVQSVGLTENSSVLIDETNELTNSIILFKNNREKSQLKICVDQWELIDKKETKYDSANIIPWVKSTAELFTITGDVKYVEELEELLISIENKNSDNGNHEGNSDFWQSVINMIGTVIYSKDVDHVFVNLFYESKVEYDHSLGGKVTIEQKIDPKNNGEVKLFFSMENKRYLELYIRVPSMIDEAGVEIKKVRYLAVPGEYCKIAKKWKDGDEVTINFSSKEN